MDSLLAASYHKSTTAQLQIFRFKPFTKPEFSRNSLSLFKIGATIRSGQPHSHRKPPKNLRYPRRPKLPPDPVVNKFIKKRTSGADPPQRHPNCERPESSDNDDAAEEYDTAATVDDDPVWSSDEIEAISSLFQGRIAQKPGSLYRERPLPLPLRCKLGPLRLPTSKKHVRMISPLSSRLSLSKQAYKNPDFLLGLAREIRRLPSDKDASEILNKWVQFLRKGSLSLTIRELGHMGLPQRALQTFCWAQKQSHLFPDDRILASTIEILARAHGLKMPFDLEKFMSSASRTVIEAMARGFIRGGNLNLARKLLLVAKDNKRTLDPSIHAKLILELGKNPDKYNLVLALLDELANIDDLQLEQQDCTAVMKVCIRLKKFDIVESLFNWYRESGRDLSVVMYTTMIHSRHSEKKYREALALVWEMEGSNCLFDLPAYRVVIKLFVYLNDLSRAVRYFSRLKDAGFSPTYDIYRNLIKIYAVSGRLAKCKELCKETEMAGFKLDKQMESLFLVLGRKVGSVT
ncbi:pentatricopeptide repeat-containing protein At2g01860 [Macadamia integrifolia]|uniref:pentatricopeptide repeat-containing protein At2g01860 n=1 Tax=Macadamia integrifolia TaxID=60698 RepID=UPI001C4E8A41|nr:pentatricopeptide repeat-containing protein At2g01860 [Macadamia integrifolia]